MSGAPEYEVFAFRYAHRKARRAEHFIGGDPHDGPMPMDYYIWLIRGDGRVVVVDCGFNAEVAARRGRTLLLTPTEALRLLDIDPAIVPDLVLTHLHYDHVGNLDLFPSATFHLQEPELHYAVGRHMRYPFLRAPFELQDVLALVRLNYAGRVCLHNGVHELYPGITLHPAPGHTAGLQFVQVRTRRGMVVLASDATHFYENMQAGRPFPIIVSTPDSLESYDRVRRAASSPAHVIPGHDPLVMERYPAPSAALEGVVVRLDVAPRR
ncbi:MAG TPA: N-acyl homoserine lactonase family protein [Acetobacteraceae bacterium]|nr:N-acyl homoserine lactonase family protein [Acetobacteraceae bacterium]